MKLFRYGQLYLLLAVFLAACGGGGGGGGGSTLTPAATLSSFDLGGVQLDQIFQPTQTVYTASVGFLIGSVRLDASSANAGAIVMVNGTTINAAGIDVSLAQGSNAIQIRTTADGFTSTLYTLTVTRETSVQFSQAAYIKASNPDEFDVFGRSVALSGDTLAVGAWAESSVATGIDGDQSDNNAVSSGAVYVFTRDGTGGWSQEAYIKASNTDAGDNFGRSVALSGNTLAVGAFESSAATGINGNQGDNNADFSGAVYVFTRDGVGVWSQQAYIKASNTDAGDTFGRSVALSGDTLAVGAFESSAATGIDGDRATTTQFVPVPSMCSRARVSGSGRSRLTSKRRTPMRAISSDSRSRSPATRWRSAPQVSPASRPASTAIRATTTRFSPVPSMCLSDRQRH